MKTMKKTIAFMLAFTLVAGALPMTSGNFLKGNTEIVAHATEEGTYWRIEEKGDEEYTLYIKGNLILDGLDGELTSYNWFEGLEEENRMKVTAICADAGTTLQGNLCEFFNNESFPNVETIDLSNVTASNITSMQDMFINLGKLTSINFGNNFDTSGVENMSDMFWGCRELTSLDLSKFVITEETYVLNMFRYCIKLTSLTVGENFTQGISQNMSLLNIGYTYDENEYLYVPSGERYGWYKDLKTKTIISGEGDNAVIDASYISPTVTTTFYRSDYTPPTGGDEGGTGEGTGEGGSTTTPETENKDMTVSLDVQAMYTVTIPASVTLSPTSDVTESITAENVMLDENQKITVTLSSASNTQEGNVFHAKKGDSSTATYGITVNGQPVSVGGTVAEFTGNGTSSLTFTKAEGATRAGRHTETLTFTISTSST